MVTIPRKAYDLNNSPTPDTLGKENRSKAKTMHACRTTFNNNEFDEKQMKEKANGPAKGVPHGMKIAWNRINENK